MRLPGGTRVGCFSFSKGYQAAAEKNTAGRAAADSGGLPRYKDGQGGSSGTGAGGSEGGPSGSGQRAVNAGRWLEANGDGSYRVSAMGIERLDPTFKNWGYDVRNARIEFKDMWIGPAETDCNTIRIDPDAWESRASMGLQAQGEMLSHELTHSAQFQKLGREPFLSRLRYERVTNIDPYAESDTLKGMTLSQMNPVDRRFTLESMAVHAESAWMSRGYKYK